MRKSRYKIHMALASKATLKALACCVLFAGASVYGRASEVSPVDRVSRYIRDIRYGMEGERTEELVDALATPIVEASERYNLDPMLVSVIISTESSFNKKALGTRGRLALCKPCRDISKNNLT